MFFWRLLPLSEPWNAQYVHSPCTSPWIPTMFLEALCERLLSRVHFYSSGLVARTYNASETIPTLMHVLYSCFRNSEAARIISEMCVHHPLSGVTTYLRLFARTRLPQPVKYVVHAATSPGRNGYFLHSGVSCWQWLAPPSDKPLHLNSVSQGEPEGGLWSASPTRGWVSEGTDGTGDGAAEDTNQGDVWAREPVWTD